MGASDWEDLMNGVFGPGGRLRAGTAKPARNEKTAETAQQALQKNQKALDEALARQAQEIARLGGELEHTMQRDGLLTEAETQAARRTVPAPCKRMPLTDWSRRWSRPCWASRNFSNSWCGLSSGPLCWVRREKRPAECCWCMARQAPENTRH